MSSWKHAFAISKDEISAATPPGTVVLIQHNKQDGETHDTTLRIPVPSEDPADPLNWPSWRKHSMLLVASLYGFVANFASAAIAPGLQLWPLAFPQDPRPFTELTQLVAVNVLFQGAANIWWVPLSNTYGRRPVLLVATLVMTLCSVWCGLATSFNSLLVARIFQGIGESAADTVCPALVGDVYFVDERGRAMAIYTIFLVAGPLVGGLAGGYIAFQLGWAYVFWVTVALSAACFIATLLLVPETLYIRDTALLSTGSSEPVTSVEKAEDAQHLEQATSAPALRSYPPYTFARSLGLRKPMAGSGLSGLAHNFLRPWRTLALPGTWVVMLHYGGLVGGVVTISTLAPQLVAEPPYLWGANSGLINVGGLVGAVLGLGYTYAVADARLQSTARHGERGFAEPEARLPTMFPALIIATAGLLTFGLCAQNPSPKGWVGLAFGFGMLNFGLMQVPSIGFNYLIDSYSYLAADCFVVVTILRAIIAFAWTFFVAEWIAADGAAEPFGIFAMLMGIFTLLTIPLWLYGKRMRMATAGIMDI
ncbi:major facilitator superfamily domain-containing protein [Xylariales sp. PMI_506]|nr:major facilitator superfamily domain-containing protein [Xylariales sp. PMI_506]